MIELPSLFSKTDFFGTLLPGYIAIILAIVLFRPELILKPEKALSFDLFSTVVFLVAGPATGFTIQLFHRYLFHSITSLISCDSIKRLQTVTKYAAVMLKATSEEKLELAQSLATYDFCVSTGMILVLIGIYYSVSQGSVQVYITIPMLFVAFILFLGAHFELKETYTPLFNQLSDAYPAGGPA